MSTEPKNTALLRIVDRRNKEKFFIDDVFIDKWASKVGQHATLVYFALCRHANAEQKAFPSIPFMAKELGISVSTVKRGLSKLVSCKIVFTEQLKGGHGLWKNNVYSLADKTAWQEHGSSIGAPARELYRTLDGSSIGHLTGALLEPLRSVHEELRNGEGALPIAPPTEEKNEKEKQSQPPSHPEVQPLTQANHARPIFDSGPAAVVAAFEPISPGISSTPTAKPSRRGELKAVNEIIAENETAAAKLIELCGSVEQAVATVGHYISRYDSKYCPKAYDPKSFVEKLPRILGFIRSNPQFSMPAPPAPSLIDGSNHYTEIEKKQLERFKKYSQKNNH